MNISRKLHFKEHPESYLKTTTFFFFLENLDDIQAKKKAVWRLLYTSLEGKN